MIFFCLNLNQRKLSFVQILPEKKSLASFCPCRVGKVASLLFWWMRAWLVPNTAVSQRVRALPLDNSVASQAVFQVTCCTISGGCQSWSIRLSDAFNTQYYSTFFLLFPGGKLFPFFFACVSVLVKVCVWIYLRQSVRMSTVWVSPCIPSHSDQTVRLKVSVVPENQLFYRTQVQ